MKPSISIVICTHNRAVLLERCLAALTTIVQPSIQVLVVDNAPACGATRLLAQQYNTAYQLAPVRGLSRARNIGLQACTSDIVAFLDDDMIAHPAWLAELAACFDDPAVVAVTGPMLPMALVDGCEAALACGLQESAWGAAPFHVDRHSPDWFARANFGGLGDGNFAVRRSVLASWRGFEETIGRGMPLDSGEDHYAFFSLIAQGHRIAYNPRAIVFHPAVVGSLEHRLYCLTLNVAYSCLLLYQHPRYAPHLLWLIVRAIAGNQRRRRNHKAALIGSVPSLLQRLRAFCKGVQLFWSTLRSQLATASGG